MKFFKILTILLILSFFQQATAQKQKTDAALYGDVQCNGEHVPFINITLEGTTIGTTTDATGHFYLNNLPIGTFTVTVSGIGYKSVTREITTKANVSQEIKFIVEEDILNMEEVVVSANRNQTNRADAPVVITSVSPALLARTQSDNLAEGLNFTPGLRTELDCQNCGYTQLRMNGLNGPYTQILLNSRPVFSGMASVYGLELIPANMVERIEVVRGGGSALFGGNAIAGTVNVITKESKVNSFNLSGQYGIIGLGNKQVSVPVGDALVNMNASVVTDDGNSGAYIYGMHRDRDAVDENGDDFSELVAMNQTTFGFNAYHKPGSKSKISLDGYRINELRRGGNKMDYVPHEADLAEQVTHRITGGNLSFDLFTNDKYDKLSLYIAAQGVDRDSYYGAQRDPDAYGHTNDFTSSAGAQYVLHSDQLLQGISTTVFGIENNTNLVQDQKMGSGGEKNLPLTHQMVSTLGAFVQEDWKTGNLSLALGLRSDYYMIKDMNENTADRQEPYNNLVLAPRISVLYKITPNIRFRIGYGKGYRAPQVYSEDLHVELISAKRVVHLNDPDLVQETSHSFTSSLNMNFNTGASIHELLTEGFYTLLQDPFANVYYQLDSTGSWAYLRINADHGAFVAGTNLELNSYWTDHLSSQLSITFQTSRYQSIQSWGNSESSQSLHFMRSPDTYGYATLNWEPSKHFRTTLTLTYTGPMYVPHFGLDPDTDDPLEQEALENGDVIAGERLERSNPFLVTDLLFSYDFHLSNEVSLQLFTGMQNIFNQIQSQFDRGVFRDSGYIYGPSQPRTLSFGLRFGNLTW